MPGIGRAGLEGLVWFLGCALPGSLCPGLERGWLIVASEDAGRGEGGGSSSSWVLRVLVVVLLVLVAVFVVLVRGTFSVSKPGREVTINRLYSLASANRVREATLLDQEAQVVGRFCPSGRVSGCRSGLVSFHAAYPQSDVATQQLIDRLGGRARLEVRHQTGKAVARLVITFVLPLMILAALFGIIFVVAAAGGDSDLAGVVGFGRLGKKQKREKATEDAVTFADVAGIGDVVTEVQEVIDYLRDPTKFEAFAAVAPKGVLLFGPPGCGKTLMARAVAGESGVPFITASGTDFVESLVGVGAARVRDLFSQARELAPAIVFIDEIDAVGRTREGEGVSGGEREQTLNQLLVEMDGFDVSSGIVLMGATNRPDILDAALMRPGRFDRHITLEPPDADGRAEILAVHARRRPVAADVDLFDVARQTPGFTGADLANVINEAALLAVREGQEGGQVSARHFSEAIQRVLHGPHRGKLMTADERYRLAVHESGHAVVASAVGRRTDIHRVSILAQGAGVAKTSMGGDGDRVLLTDHEIQDRLAIMMAGMAAEARLCDRPSTTAENDIAQATALAKEMVGLYGMSAGIGPVRVLARYGGFLSADGTSMEAIGDQSIETFDTEVRQLIETAKDHATQLLTDHQPALTNIITTLEQEETLEGTALQQLLDTVTPSSTNGHHPHNDTPTRDLRGL